MSLVQCHWKKDDDIRIDGHPSIRFKVSNYPLSDQFGKVQTKILAGWSNVPDDSSQVKLVVPTNLRPKTRSELQHKETTVLRVKAEKKYCTSKIWTQVTGQPGTVVRKWIIGTAPNCRNSVQDTWGWELQPGSHGAQTVVKGLVRVKKSDALTSLLTASGRSFEGLRIFLDPLKWDDTSWKDQPFISWVEKLEHESETDYAARVAKMANMGIAKGWKQLGMRSTTDPGEQKSQAKTWILRSAPRHWNLEGVESFLGGAGFFDTLNSPARNLKNMALLGSSKGQEREIRITFSCSLKEKISLLMVSFLLLNGYSALSSRHKLNNLETKPVFPSRPSCRKLLPWKVTRNSPCYGNGHTGTGSGDGRI